MAAGVGQSRWRWVPGGCAVVVSVLCASSSSMMAGPAAAGPLAARQTTMPGHSGGDVEQERQPLLLTPAKATTTTAVEQASSSALPPTARSLWEVMSTRENRAGRESRLGPLGLMLMPVLMLTPPHLSLSPLPPPPPFSPLLFSSYSLPCPCQTVTLLLIAHATQQLCGISPVIAYSTSILAPQHGSPVGAHGVHRLVSRSMFTTTISASALSTGQLALAIAAAKVPLTLAPVFLIKVRGSLEPRGGCDGSPTNCHFLLPFSSSLSLSQSCSVAAKRFLIVALLTLSPFFVGSASAHTPCSSPRASSSPFSPPRFPTRSRHPPHCPTSPSHPRSPSSLPFHSVWDRSSGVCSGRHYHPKIERVQAAWRPRSIGHSPFSP